MEDILQQYQQGLRAKQGIEKAVCDASDAFAIERLGHHYVRVNNRTVQVRGYWRKWEQLSELLSHAEPSHVRNITDAMQHYNNKLERCQERLFKYVQRGLMLRSKFQAAEKVLKVVTDVEQAHAVLLAHTEGILQEVSSRSAGLAAAAATAAATVLSVPSGAQTLPPQISPTGGQAWAHSQHSQQPSDATIQDATPMQASDKQPAHWDDNPRLRRAVSTAGTQTDLDTEPEADTWKGRAAAAAELARSARKPLPSHNPSFASPTDRGSSGGGGGMSSFLSPIASNPLSKPGYMVQVPQARGLQAQSGGGAVSPLHKLAAEPPQGRAAEAVAEISALAVDADGTVTIGGQRYMVAWAPQAAVGSLQGANALLVPVPAASPLPQHPLGPLPLPLSGGLAGLAAAQQAQALQAQQQQQQAGWLPPYAAVQPSSAGTADAAAYVAVPGSMPASISTPATAPAQAMQHPYPSAMQPMHPAPAPSPQEPPPPIQLPDLPPPPPGSHEFTGPLLSASLSHLAAGSLSARAARQLLACYSPGSATAVLQALARQPGASQVINSSSAAAAAAAAGAGAGGAWGWGLPPRPASAAATSGPPAVTHYSPAAAQQGHTRASTPAHSSSTPRGGAGQASTTRAARPEANARAHNVIQPERAPAARRSLWAQLPAPGSSAASLLQPRLYAGSPWAIRSEAAGSPVGSPVGHGSYSGYAGARRAMGSALARGSPQGVGQGGLMARQLHEADAAKGRRAEELVQNVVAPLSGAVRQSLLLSRRVRTQADEQQQQQAQQAQQAQQHQAQQQRQGLGGYAPNGGQAYTGRGHAPMVYSAVPQGEGRWQGTQQVLVPPQLQGTRNHQGGREGSEAPRSSWQGSVEGGAGQQLGDEAGSSRHAAFWLQGSAGEEGVGGVHVEDEGGGGARGLSSGGQPMGEARVYAAGLSARAEDGDMEAVEELGHMIRRGAPGLPAQPDVARGLLMYAAEAGSASAARTLGDMLQLGEGGEPDPKEAAQWYERAEDEEPEEFDD